MLLNCARAGLAWRNCITKGHLYQLSFLRSLHITCQTRKTVYTQGQNIFNNNIKTLNRDVWTKRSQRQKLLNRNYASSSKDGPSTRRQFLLLATYGSFGVGAVLTMAILFRELKKRRLQWKGVVQMDVPAWRRVHLYKYKGVALPEFVVNTLDDLEKFEARPDDVWVVSFPRSGTTWLQEIVYLISSNMNFAKAGTQHLDDRFPYLEFMYPGIKTLESMPSPRLIKSHLPWALLPESVKQQKPKIIYIARNPRDVVVSYFYYTRLLHPVTRYDGKFEEFFDLFLQDKVMYSPWSSHVLDFWDNRHDDNILYITYEDLKKDTSATIDKIAQFLGKPVSETDKQKILTHCSFERMKSNNMTNHSWFKTLGLSDPKQGEFMRKGCVGDWANHFTKDMSLKMNQMVGLKFRDSDLSFAYQGTHFVNEGDEEILDTKPVN